MATVILTAIVALTLGGFVYGLVNFFRFRLALRREGHSAISMDTWLAAFGDHRGHPLAQRMLWGFAVMIGTPLVTVIVALIMQWVRSRRA